MTEIFENRPRIEILKQPQSVYRMRYETDNRKTNLFAESFSDMMDTNIDMLGDDSSSDSSNEPFMAAAATPAAVVSASTSLAASAGLTSSGVDSKRRKREYISVKVIGFLFTNLI